MSLLKILLTNFYVFYCAYCVNRVSSNVRRARFTPAEVVQLTLDFYKRNCIEGLFLSSGIIRNSDYTMEQLVEVARSLRQDHRFAGYIHLKAIPDAAPELLAAAGRHADRPSINVELPTESGLAQLLPELIQSAGTRVRDMVERAPEAPRRRIPETPTMPGVAPEDSLAAVRAAAEACRRCELWQPATRTVFGEGPPEVRVVLVGEQPGDEEDLSGRPFVGPAGKLLDRVLRELGIDRRALYLTNAVKHFRFE